MVRGAERGPTSPANGRRGRSPHHVSATIPPDFKCRRYLPTIALSTFRDATVKKANRDSRNSDKM